MKSSSEHSDLPDLERDLPTTPDDVCALVGQWRGNYLTITVQGAAPAPHAERNEVPQP